MECERCRNNIAVMHEHGICVVQNFVKVPYDLIWLLSKVLVCGKLTPSMLQLVSFSDPRYGTVGLAEGLGTRLCYNTI